MHRAPEQTGSRSHGHVLRLCFYLAMCLVLGALTTVTIALLCAAASGARPGSPSTLSIELDAKTAQPTTDPILLRAVIDTRIAVEVVEVSRIVVHAPRGIPPALRVAELSALVPNRVHIDHLPPWSRETVVAVFDHSPGSATTLIASGWPWRALVGYSIQGTGSSWAFRTDRSRRERFPRLIPFKPMPIGFALDTLLFASCFAVSGFTALAMRGRIRARFHRCTRCGYSLSGLAARVCPECGAVAPRMAHRDRATRDAGETERSDP